MDFKLEVIGFNIESCLVAQESGAHRVELCDGPGEGGTTASYGFIREARKRLDIELYPIIRPRGGDFLYSEDEFEIMKDDIKLCKKLGCDGIVTGILNPDGSVDKKRTGQLTDLAYPLGVTFHRAFDRTADAFKAMEDIIDCGCERILTSGQKPGISEGAALVAKLVNKAEHRIIIMPGSGLRSSNIRDIAVQTGATEFHTSARKMKPGQMTYANKSMQEELQYVHVDGQEIRSVINILKAL